MDIDYHPSPRRLSLTGGSFSRIPFAPRTTVFIQSNSIEAQNALAVGGHSLCCQALSGQKLSNSYRGSSRLHVAEPKSSVMCQVLTQDLGEEYCCVRMAARNAVVGLIEVMDGRSRSALYSGVYSALERVNITQ
jgi:hypothetical protein